MRKYRVGLFIIFLSCIGIDRAISQSCVSTINNTVFNLSCGVNCSNVNLQIPDLRTTSDYTVNPISYNPYPFVSSVGGMTVPCASQDDKFFDTVFLPFDFCFYDSLFSKCALGTNGVISFDVSNVLRGNNWDLDPPLTIPNTGPGTSGAMCGIPSNTLYPRSAIMGPYADIFPQVSDPFYKIETRTEGIAPCRRFIVSFSEVPLFGCSTSRVTSQMVLYEGTAIIEIYVESKPFCSFNANTAIIGIQDWTRTKGIAAPSRNAGSWTAIKEAYRFVPSGGATRFINSQLYTMSGTFVAAATASFTTAGNIDLSFPNICPNGNSEKFIVRTKYSSCADPNSTLDYTDTIIVNKTSSLSASTTVTDLNCVAGSTGSITVNVGAGSGVPPFQYSINGGTLQSSNVFTGLSVGNYTVSVIDVNGCNTSLNTSVNRIGNLSLSYSFTNTTCSGATNGSITVFPSSVYLPIQYSLNGGAPQTTNTFTGLAAGNYTVDVNDAAGCSGTITITIASGTGITATGSMTPTSCAGSNSGTITVFANGGSLPYQYSINGGASQTSNVFTGLAAGAYTVRVTDASGCYTTFSIIVNSGTPLIATVIKTDVTCNGGSNGTITVNVSNGTAPYQYSLDNLTWQAGNIFNGLAPGNYTVYYKDNNTCSNSQSVAISQPTPLIETLTFQSPRCFGYNDGSITANASGGTSPYQYSLDNINWQLTNTFNNIAAGTYTIYCRDAKGCTSSKIISITQPAQIITSASTVNATCNGGANGQIIVTANGGTGSLYYALPGPPFSTNNIFNVAPGTYSVMVVDQNVCLITIPNIVVGLTNDLSITPAADTTICEGKSAQLNANTNATQFSWLPVTGLSNAAIQNPVANPTVTTQYVVTANYGQCSGKDTIIVNVNKAPVPNAGPDVEICYGQDYQLQGSGGVQYIWSPPSTLSNGALPNPISNTPQTTIYSLIVIDSNGCSSLVPDQMTLTVTPPIIVKTNPKDTVVFSGDKFQLLASSAATNYSWSPPTGLSNPFIANPTITVTSDITYSVAATTAAGCRGDGTVTVKVFKGPEIYLPTGFTPNGDGKNDVFKPFTVGIVKINYFRVYNRWGRLLYSTSNLNEGWDGRIGGVDQPTSTFVWMVQGVARDGKVITKKGTVTLIR